MKPTIHHYATRLMTCDDAPAVVRLGGEIESAQDVGEWVGDAMSCPVVATCDGRIVAYALAERQPFGIWLTSVRSAECEASGDYGAFSIVEHLKDLVPQGLSLVTWLESESLESNDFLRRCGFKASAFFRSLDTVEMKWRRRA